MRRLCEKWTFVLDGNLPTSSRFYWPKFPGRIVWFLCYLLLGADKRRKVLSVTDRRAINFDHTHCRRVRNGTYVILSTMALGGQWAFRGSSTLSLQGTRKEGSYRFILYDSGKSRYLRRMPSLGLEPRRTKMSRINCLCYELRRNWQR